MISPAGISLLAKMPRPSYGLANTADWKRIATSKHYLPLAVFTTRTRSAVLDRGMLSSFITEFMKMVISLNPYSTQILPLCKKSAMWKWYNHLDFLKWRRCNKRGELQEAAPYHWPNINFSSLTPISKHNLWNGQSASPINRREPQSPPHSQSQSPTVLHISLLYDR